MVDGLDRDERDGLVSKRHKRREAMKRHARMKLRKRHTEGYTHHGAAAGVVFMAGFLALVIAVIQIMGRWAAS